MPTETATGDSNLSREQVSRAKAGFELDLIAFYKALEEEASDVIAREAAKGSSPDQIVRAVDALFE